MPQSNLPCQLFPAAACRHPDHVVLRNNWERHVCGELRFNGIDFRCTTAPEGSGA